MTKKMIDNYKGVWQPKIIQLARTKNSMNKLVQQMDEAIEQDLPRKSGEKTNK